MYQNVNYRNNREKVQTIVLHLTDDSSTSNHDTNTMFDTDHVNFRVTLQEPMIIDKLSDVYLEFVLSSNTKGKDPLGDQTSFLLSIDQFNVNSVSNQSESYNKILIPNEHSETNLITPASHVTLHKSKKLNYVCSINPCRLYELSGKLTFLNGLTSFYPHREPIIHSVTGTPPYLTTNTNKSPGVGGVVGSTGAHDLGYIDVTKTLDIRIDVLDEYDVDKNHDTELFIFKSEALSSNSDIEDNTLSQWAETEHSTASTTDGATSGERSYHDHNDDSVGYESKLTYTANQLPVMNGYYWIAACPFDTAVPATDITGDTTVKVLGGSGLTGMGRGGGTDVPWVAGDKLQLIITSDGTPIVYSKITLEAGLGIYWFRFESTDHSKNFVSQFNIIPRE
jgi:hypothetical protein